jgi:hypothetical protein
VNAAELIQLVDGLEDKSESYLTLAEVENAVGGDVTWAIAERVLLVDYRMHLDGTRVTLCRLNRRHPLVAELTRW